jgi:uncharacterized protein (DUF2267 family)
MAIHEGQPGEMSWSGEGMGTSRASFLAKVEGRLAGEPPAEAAVAVFCTLSQRISGGVVEMISQQLPEDLRQLLRPCGHHQEERARSFDKEDFYLAVAEHLRVEPTEVRRILHAVFAGLHSQVTEAVAEKVASQLPGELMGTWVAARKDVAAPH